MSVHSCFMRTAFCFCLMLAAVTGSAQRRDIGIASAIASLGDKDPAVRQAGVMALIGAGSEAVSSLVKALASPDESVRANAALVLGKIGAPAADAVPCLIAVLKDESDPVRENAAGALGEMGPGAAQAVNALLSCLSDRNPFVAGRSAEALAGIGAPAVAGLITSLADSSAAARWSATIALGKMGPDASAAVPALTHALADPSEEVRWGAAVALGNCGETARPAVRALLVGLSDSDQDVRRGATLALEHIDPSAADVYTNWRAVASTVDTLVLRLMKETRVPGVAIALINNGAHVWSGRYGIASTQSGDPVNDGTMFEACSMTKPVFAYLVMHLVEERKLDLDRPLINYVDPSSLRGQPDHGRITARMVLSHTSGLPNWRKGEEERDGPLPVMFAPGSKFSYSGEGYFLLQKVVEHITGEPLDVYARRTMFDPLGLHHMSFAWTDAFDASIAGGHDAAGAFLTKSRYAHPNAAYTLYTSASDYAKLLVAIMNPDSLAGRILSRRSVDTMLAHQVVVTSRDPIERPGKASGSAVSWGLGWSINATAQGDIVHHSGANRTGFRCFAQFNRATKSGIVIMTNGLRGDELWTRLISRVGNL